jgi:hypothetical protein
MLERRVHRADEVIETALRAHSAKQIVICAH